MSLQLTNKLYNLRYELLRFGFSGGISTFLYGFFALAFGWATDLAPVTIHLLAFFLCLPVSYTLQRVFTFSFKGSISRSAGKFAVLSVSGMLIGTVIVGVVEKIGVSPYWGTVTVMVAIPVTSYFVMKIWIFREKNQIL